MPRWLLLGPAELGSCSPGVHGPSLPSRGERPSAPAFGRPRVDDLRSWRLVAPPSQLGSASHMSLTGTNAGGPACLQADIRDDLSRRPATSSPGEGKSGRRGRTAPDVLGEEGEHSLPRVGCRGGRMAKHDRHVAGEYVPFPAFDLDRGVGWSIEIPHAGTSRGNNWPTRCSKPLSSPGAKSGGEG